MFSTFLNHYGKLSPNPQLFCTNLPRIIFNYPSNFSITSYPDLLPSLFFTKLPRIIFNLPSNFSLTSYPDFLPSLSSQIYPEFFSIYPQFSFSLTNQFYFQIIIFISLHSFNYLLLQPVHYLLLLLFLPSLPEISSYLSSIFL